MTEKINDFKKDLKEVFKNHNVELKETHRAWHGGGDTVIEIYIDSKCYFSQNLEEVLDDIEVLSYE